MRRYSEASSSQMRPALFRNAFSSASSRGTAGVASAAVVALVVASAAVVASVVKGLLKQSGARKPGQHPCSTPWTRHGKPRSFVHAPVSQPVRSFALDLVACRRTASSSARRRLSALSRTRARHRGRADWAWFPLTRS
jgi:hypothetical protein